MNEHVEMVRRMKVSGLTYAEIGKRLGFSRQRAQQLIRLWPKSNDTTCEACGSCPPVLHCHHVNYSTNQFRLLCIRCHGKEHGGTRHAQQSKIKTFLSGADLMHYDELVASAKKIGVDPEKLVKAAKDSPVRVISRRQKVPWHLFDWSMPSRVLAKLWKVSVPRIAAHRYDCHVAKTKKCPCKI